VGVIAGAVVGAVLGVALIVGAVILGLWWLKKNRNGNEPSIKRNTSTMSRAGLIVKPIDTNLAAAQDGSSMTPGSNSHRDSGFLRPMQNSLLNTSRASFHTINDNEDYSRPLKVSRSLGTAVSCNF
jgi:hypothetical protein